MVKAKKAILLDVAKRAGVSRATAARALGDYSTVKDETRKRIIAAAKELDYKPNDLARAMRSGRTSTIGVIVSDISNSFFGAAVRSISDAAQAAGYQTLLINTNEDAEAEERALRILVEKRVDGLLIVPVIPSLTVRLIEDYAPSVPVVFLDRKLDEFKGASVVSGDERSAYAAARHLIEIGHRRIGALVATSATETFSAEMPPEMVSTAQKRHNGVVRAFRDADLAESRPATIFCRSDVAIAERAAGCLLEQGVTAAIATNEEMALGLIAACRTKKIALGTELSVISFDDAPWCSVFVPNISVICRPVGGMGQAAVQLLVDEIRTGKRAESVVLENLFVPRDSVQPPA